MKQAPPCRHRYQTPKPRSGRQSIPVHIKPIEITLNGEKTETYAENIKEFLVENNIDPATVATAVNGEFIPRTHHENQLLSAGMKLEVLAPMQGG